LQCEVLARCIPLV